jgi:hypothetical protein
MFSPERNHDFLCLLWHLLYPLEGLLCPLEVLRDL